MNAKTKEWSSVGCGGGAVSKIYFVEKYKLTLPSLTHLAPLKSLIALYINICKITFFPSTQCAYIYDSIFLCKLCYKDKLGQTYINMHIEWKEKM